VTASDSTGCRSPPTPPSTAFTTKKEVLTAEPSTIDDYDDDVK
jgi:hypothetical protein